ncbi:hypothetical protein C0992_004170, partial [Termitomyces sp. T32_za158]
TLTTTSTMAESRITVPQRPLGPRTHRSPSPMLAPTTPLDIRKSPKTPDPGLSISPPQSRSHAYSPSLQNITPSRAATPNPPAIRLAIPQGRGASLFQSYYGGPDDPTGDPDTARPGVTIRPPSSVDSVTCVPVSSNVNGFGATDVKEMIDSLNNTNYAPLTFSDEVFEEIERLGEGAGGAVHKVKDKRTNRIMARKTITTREAPMKQLLREVSIISNTKHMNIIQFYGAYMSPSSSEVKILMDYCEGGSLESVGKRIKERGAIVGELIAGRVAEGVR